MKHSLERLIHVIGTLLHPSIIRSYTPKQIEDIIKVLQLEKQNICTHLLRRSLKIKSEEQLELLIQQYQAEIIRLMDIVYRDKSQIEDRTVWDVYDIMLTELKEILSHIERRYSRYFNLEEKVPEAYLIVSQSELKRRANHIKNQLFLSREMQAVAFIIHKELTVITKRKDIPYGQLVYFKNMVDELEELLKASQTNFSVMQLVHRLVYLNFNTPDFVACLINRIVEGVNEAGEGSEKVDILSRYQKQFSQMPVRPGVALRSSVESVKDQIVHWLSEEIVYHEQKYRLITVARVSEGQTITDDQKLHLSVSADVLSILARAAKDSKLILNKQTTAMFRNLSKLCRTIRSETVSANSLVKKSYVADRSSKQSAIDILHEMIKFIHKYCLVPFAVYQVGWMG